MGKSEVKGGAPQGVAIDPEFNDEVPGIDPEGQEFRDQLEIGESLDQLGVVQGIDAELRESERQRESDTLEVLEAMRGLDHGETVKWRITRTGTGDPQLDGFLDTWPSKMLTLERIRDKMGGGTFYLKGFRNGKYWVHKTVEIAGVPKMYVKGAATVDAATGAPVSTQAGFDITAFLAQQAARDAQVRREQEEREQKRRQEREEREERDRKSRNELLAIVMPVVGSIGTALTAAFTGNRGSQMADIAALMAAMKGPDPITVLTQLKALERSGNDGMMSKILPMLIDMAGDRATSGESGWMDVVKELAKGAAPALGEMIQQQAATRAGSGVNGNTPVTPSLPMAVSTTQTPALPNGGLIVVPESRPRRERPGATASARGASTADTVSSRSGGNGVGGNMDMAMMSLIPHLAWLRDQLSRMLVAATNQRDPEVYAAIFLEELPNGVSSQTLGQLLGADDWFEHLVQLDPRLGQVDCGQWFAQVRQLILVSIEEELGASIARHGRPSRGSSADSRATVQVAVRGPAESASAPQVGKDGVERPGKLPSLSGD